MQMEEKIREQIGEKLSEEDILKILETIEAYPHDWKVYLNITANPDIYNSEIEGYSDGNDLYSRTAVRKPIIGDTKIGNGYSKPNFSLNSIQVTLTSYNYEYCEEEKEYEYENFLDLHIYIPEKNYEVQTYIDNLVEKHKEELREEIRRKAGNRLSDAQVIAILDKITFYDMNSPLYFDVTNNPDDYNARITKCFYEGDTSYTTVMREILIGDVEIEELMCERKETEVIGAYYSDFSLSNVQAVLVEHTVHMYIPERDYGKQTYIERTISTYVEKIAELDKKIKTARKETKVQKRKQDKKVLALQEIN